MIAAEVGDLLPGRPGEVDHPALEACHLHGFPAVGRHRPDRVDLLQASRFAAVGNEGYLTAVRRPRGGVDLVRGRGEALRFGLVDVGDPQARVLVADADAVEAPGVVADPPRGGVVGVAGDEALLAGAGEEEQPGPVGRPLRAADAAREVGDLSWFAAGEIEEPGLGLARAVGDEDELPAVAREPRAVVAGLGAGELLWFSALEACPPEPARVLAVFDRPLDVDDGRRVGRHRERRDDDLLQYVLRLERRLDPGFCLFPLDRLHVLSMLRKWKGWKSWSASWWRSSR